MPTQSGEELIYQEYLPVRAKLLEIAASLDRIERGGGASSDDPQLTQLRAGIKILLQPDGDRAERLQMLFSRPYDAQWLDRFEPTR